MKPEKPINTMSEVYKLVQEEEQNKGIHYTNKQKNTLKQS